MNIDEIRDAARDGNVRPLGEFHTPRLFHLLTAPDPFYPRDETEEIDFTDADYHARLEEGFGYDDE